MTITFRPNQTTDPAYFAATCCCDQTVHFTTDDWDDAMALFVSIDGQNVRNECCDTIGCYIEARYDGPEMPELNVSNTNAQQVLVRLGYDVTPDDYCGTIDAVDLLGRCMVGNVGQDDSGVAPSEHIGSGGARIIECGLRPGYFEDALSMLAEVAVAARDAGVDVVWS